MAPAALHRASCASCSSSSSSCCPRAAGIQRRRSAAARAAAADAPAPPPLVVVGSVNADLVLRVERLPAPGETLGAASLDVFPGGKGGNQAAAAARLGFPTAFVGNVGRDANAAMLRDALAGAGVQLEHLRSVDGPSGTAVILLQDGGENSIIIVGGANQASWALPEATQQLVASARLVLLQREIPESVDAQVAGIAAAAGVPVLLDAGGVDAPLSHDLLRSVSIISPNETELGRLAGMQADGSEQQLLRAALALQQRAADARQPGAPQLDVLVKLGTAGSMYVRGGEVLVRQPAIPAPRVVDTTGAGDCFTASFAVALLEGLATADAMRFAAAAAAICVSRAGALPSLPARPEVEALLAAQ